MTAIAVSVAGFGGKRDGSNRRRSAGLDRRQRQQQAQQRRRGRRLTKERSSIAAESKKRTPTDRPGSDRRNGNGSASVGRALGLGLLGLVSALAPGSVAGTNATNTTSGPIISVGNIVTYDNCYKPLYEADSSVATNPSNPDRKVGRTEYITFLNSLAYDYVGIPNYFDYANGDLNELPLRITLTFNHLSCSCKDYFPEKLRDGCCILDKAHIATNGTKLGETPNENQTEYLYNVCDESMEAVYDTVTAAPTLAPTKTPAPSERPSEPPSTSPSSSPSAAPSADPTSTPSDAPSSPPTTAPSSPPSESPTSSVVPTTAPSAPPTLAPVSGTPPPSASTQPSQPPTDAPSATPTDAPSSAPSSPPTETPPPSGVPSEAPSTVPTKDETSSAPSAAPSSAPTKVPGFTGVAGAVVEFGISNGAGLSAFDIIKNDTIREALHGAVDALADRVVASSTFRVRRLGHVRIRLGRGGGSRRDDGPETGDRRRLAVEAGASELTTLEDTSCNSGDSGTCQYCESTIPLSIVDEIKDNVLTTFTNNMEAAIASGGLNLSLVGLTAYSNPQQPTTNPPLGANIQSQSSGTLSSEGQAGIGAAAGFIGLVAAVALFITQRKKQRRREEKAAEEDNNSLVSYNNGTSSEEDLLGPDGKSRSLSSAQKAGTLGASMPHYGGSNKNKTRGFATLDDDSSMEDSGSGVGSPDARRDRGGAPAAHVHSPHSMIDDSVESSSNAGSSGWSSSAGVSSLNTASVDSIEFGNPRDARGSSLAAIGVASGMTNRMGGGKSGSGLQFVPVTRDMNSLGDSTLDSNEPTAADLLNNSASDPNSVPTLPTVSRADLDQAIEAGDWAAVGATAALLASASDSQSNASSLKSRSTYRSRTSTVSSIDAARANELDHLVDSGDWEGVVLAAAKFEASSVDGGSKSMGSASHSTSDPKSTLTDGTSDPSKSTTTRSMGDSSAYSPSVATSVSESPSKAQKRAEIRREVEALVRRVVPDEIDNVDEMMLQFNGREEELVETLRTMQERSIAQRARAAVHRSAKREARRSRASGSGFPPPVPPRPPTAAAARPSASAPSNDSGGGGGGMGAGAAAAIGVGAAAAAGGAVALAHNAAKKEDNTGDNNATVRGNASVTTGSMPPANKPLHPEGSLAPLGIGAGSAGQNKSDENTEFSDPEFTAIKDASDKQLSTSSSGLPLPGRTKENSSRGSGSNSGSAKDRSMADRRSRDCMSSGPETSESEYAGDRSSTLGSGMSSNNQRHKSALELAIEAGDWEAVGEAAAMMSDASITTASTAEINALANAPDYDTDDSRHSGGYVSPGGVNAERAAELDKMIDRGDWTGVVAAATRFSNSDKAKMGSVRSGLTSGSSGSGILKPLSSSVGRGRPAAAPPTKDRALQEEEDALAQAEIWMAIAAQSKQEGSTEAKGASDAADWAISRSLSAMKNAEEKGALANKGGSGKNNPKLMSSVESVGGGSSKGDKSV